MTDKTIADLIEDRFGLPTEDGRDMPANGELAAILSHRSHRRFKPDPVSDELLRVVLAAAFSAPAKSDLQQCSVIVVKDPGVRAKMNALVASQDWVPGRRQCWCSAVTTVGSARSPRPGASRIRTAIWTRF